MDILLINPPVVKPSEPPAGLARLAGTLRAHEVSHLALDANIEGLLHLLGMPLQADDTWTRRAARHLEGNLTSLRSGSAFRSMDAYTRSVTEINRVLSRHASAAGDLSLGNFTSRSRSPVRSQDLIHAALHPEESVFHGYFLERIAPLLEAHAPRIVGISLGYLSQALTAFALVGFIRGLSSGVRIVLGGGLVTSWIRGAGMENPFGGLVDELHAGPGEGLLLSLAGKEDSAWRHASDFEPFLEHGYLSPGQVFPLSASDGCYWGKCSFCPEKAEGNRYRPAPAEAVLREAEGLRKIAPDPLIHFCDNALSPAFLNAMADKGPGIPWYGFARITPQLADPDFCLSLRRSGCVMLKLGVESGDQEVLDRLGKGIRLEDTLRVLRALKAAGIGTYAYLLFGTPAEDEGSARKTLDFIVGHHELFDFLNLSIFNLPRESADSFGHETYDFSEGDLSLYQGFVHPGGWGRGRVRQFLDKELKRHQAVARIVRADPPAFTSNHAPFFLMRRPG